MTVSDVFTVPAPASVETEGAGARARVREKSSVTDSESPRVLQAIRRGAATVTSDLKTAWLWDAQGPSPRSLWSARIPDIEQVPGRSSGLQSLWTVYNHAALIVLIPLMVAFWLASHPARLLYATPIALPLITLWLT